MRSVKDAGARVRAEKAARVTSALLGNSFINVLSPVTNAEVKWFRERPGLLLAYV